MPPTGKSRLGRATWMCDGSSLAAHLARLGLDATVSATVTVLDNCEHLVDAAAALVDEALRRCPRLTSPSAEPLIHANQIKPKTMANSTRTANGDVVRELMRRPADDCHVGEV